MKYVKLFEDMNEDGYEEIDEDTYTELRSTIINSNSNYSFVCRTQIAPLLSKIKSIKSIVGKGYSIDKIADGSISIYKDMGRSSHRTWIYILPDEWYLVPMRKYSYSDGSDWAYYKCDQFDGLQKLLEIMI